MISSLRNKILAWFILFSLLFLFIIITLNSNYFKKREEKNLLIERFVRVETMLISIFKNSNSFFSSEINNSTFFETGNSIYLQRNDSLIRIVGVELKLLSDISYNQITNIKMETDTILAYITEFNVIFKQIVNLMHQRGYKDFGKEGEMRTKIHKLEQLDKINQADILMLRRHEKDYIIRHEEQYINKLYSLEEKVKLLIAQSDYFDRKQKDSVIQILDDYKLLFSKIVSLDQQLGIYNNTALKKHLDDLSFLLENHIEKLITKVNREKQALLNKARIAYFIEILISILLSSLISLLIARKITRSFDKLTQYISNLRKDDSVYATIDFNGNTDKEILMIYNEFNHLIEHLKKREKQRDIALNEIKMQELRYRQMADMLPVGIFETGVDKAFIYFNKRFEETFGYKNVEWGELKLGDVINDSNILEELNLTKTLSSIECTAMKKDGTSIPVLVYCSERIEELELAGFRGIIIDMTDRVEIINDLQEAKIKAEESDRLKTAFLANMSHEIRTPMNAIIGFSELLSEEASVESSLKEYINQIQSSGQLLIKIIDDILDIAKIESGELNAFIENIEVNSLLDDLHHHYQGIIKKNNHPLRLILSKNSVAPVYINSDPFRIRQIFNNLLNNAIKFTNEGFIEFGYNVEKEAVRFFVRDSGIGIHETKHELVFERFRQADESLARKYNGTGLGLSIVRNLVELLGGSIILISEEGKGSEFIFTIPVMSYDEGYRKINLRAERQYQKSIFNWKNHSLLLVEDDFASSQLINCILKPTGIKIISASNGIEAVEEFLKNDQINIILMDMHMPLQSGFEATKSIRKLNNVIPIIAQTAYAMADEMELCQKAGCTDYLTKPVKKLELLNIIDEYLKISKTQNVE